MEIRRRDRIAAAVVAAVGLAILAAASSVKAEAFAPPIPVGCGGEKWMPRRGDPASPGPAPVAARAPAAAPAPSPGSAAGDS